ncbi:glycosyltransferase family 4 protein [Tenacibaculum sp. SG-28]|uniref:glycosyltransferase family 4 protein n=1 Tax=Tenacibaculum sp. SG-28 TaxID=754426 RepID=UPI000CF3C452|nr:glycosyltransferase family 4 protein [Tenacibaculum sp. SG-28]PQJ22978.1 hypothetical protein BSU00_01500 [Tenacibaculum sp. SG-28]
MLHLSNLNRNINYKLYFSKNIFITVCQENLHILFLCGWYPSRVFPNNGDFIARHAQAVSKLHSVSVLHIVTDPLLNSAIEVSIQKSKQLSTYIAYVKPTSSKLAKTILFFKAYLRLIKAIGNYDIVHLNKLFPFGIFALHANLFLKKPYIISEHWTGYHAPQNKNLSPVEIKISKQIAKRAKYVCPVSVHLQKSMESIGITGNYVRVPNVVNTEIFVPKRHAKTTFKILHISSMQDTHKNISGIIKSMRLLKNRCSNFELILVGANSHQYKDLAKELGVEQRITFKEHIAHKKVIQLMQTSDVFVLFSNYENLPCVILESFACGLPVISTDVGGISEFFPKEYGYLIEVKNNNALVDKLLQIQQNPIQLEAKMHAYAAANFSCKKIANSFDQLYKEALDCN